MYCFKIDIVKACFHEAKSSARSRQKNSYSDWLKIFGKIFCHEKVEMILTFSSQMISLHFACKIKTNESGYTQ